MPARPFSQLRVPSVPSISAAFWMPGWRPIRSIGIATGAYCRVNPSAEDHSPSRAVPVTLPLEMEAAGLSLAFVAEVRSLACSMKKTWTRYRAGPAQFATVNENVTALLSAVDTIDRVAHQNPNAFPKGTVEMFETTFKEVGGKVKRSSDNIEAYCVKAFGGNSGRGTVRRTMRRGRRFAKARSLEATMCKIERDTEMAKNTLLHLQTQLVLVVKSEDIRVAVGDGGIMRRVFLFSAVLVVLLCVVIANNRTTYMLGLFTTGRGFWLQVFCRRFCGACSPVTPFWKSLVADERISAHTRCLPPSVSE